MLYHRTTIHGTIPPVGVYHNEKQYIRQTNRSRFVQQHNTHRLLVCVVSLSLHTRWYGVPPPSPLLSGSQVYKFVNPLVPSHTVVCLHFIRFVGASEDAGRTSIFSYCWLCLLARLAWVGREAKHTIISIIPPPPVPRPWTVFLARAELK